MLRKTIFIAVIIGVWTFLAIGADNLINNSSVEDLDGLSPVGWQQLPNTSSAFSTIDTPGHTGLIALVMISREDRALWQTAPAAAGIPVEVGKRYHAGFFYKTSGFSRSSTAVYQIRGWKESKKTTVIIDTIALEPEVSNWTQVSTIFFVPEDVTHIYFNFDLLSGPGKVWIDTLWLTKGDSFDLKFEPRMQPEVSNGPPTPPLNLKANPNIYGVVSLIWDEPKAAFDKDRPIKYRIYRCVADDSFKLIAEAFNLEIPWLDSEIKTDYFPIKYYITAISKSGREGNPSEEVTVQAPAALEGILISSKYRIPLKERKLLLKGERLLLVHQTDEDGKFEFNQLLPGYYSLIVYGYPNFKKEIMINKGEIKKLGEISLD